MVKSEKRLPHKKIALRVNRGARLLDAVEKTWPQRIDTGNLFKPNPITNDLLMQLFGNYHLGLIRLQFPDVPLVSFLLLWWYGFRAFRTSGYDDLFLCWQRERIDRYRPHRPLTRGGSYLERVTGKQVLMLPGPKPMDYTVTAVPAPTVKLKSRVPSFSYNETPKAVAEAVRLVEAERRSRDQ